MTTVGRTGKEWVAWANFARGTEREDQRLEPLDRAMEHTSNGRAHISQGESGGFGSQH